ncbi:hypothetical protein MesoLj131b_72190 (plasmid) [Mesorhizobium sp. 131-2-5]|uniref:hypothetical protein n=1 Tax=Mesorhizobium sp. 131-2-5 TaxID=2744519 RepID=UPI001925B83C|nr:hypothetical protein [Mesorhizobium sp. 131-2-5]BCH05220.1 hypothetical protein MesoLj131b_72190 [Mesorhizobium sp. 131-2-5]
MPIQLVCSDRRMEAPEGVAKLIAEHRQSVAELANLGKRWMRAEGPDAIVLGQKLDAAMAEEAAVRRRAAIAPVATIAEMKMKAAYFQRLTAHNWCEVDVDDFRALLGSFTKLQS